MYGISRALSLFRTLFRKEKLEAELDEELQSYAALLTDRYLKNGLSPEQARRAALLELEGVEQVKERVRDVRAAPVQRRGVGV